MLVPGMPVVFNQNTHQSLKLVDGASYRGLMLLSIRAYPRHQVSTNLILHFGPPVGILLAEDTEKEFYFVEMPPTTIPLTPISTKIDCQRKATIVTK
jgi:hypothetical protein